VPRAAADQPPARRPSAARPLAAAAAFVALAGAACLPEGRSPPGRATFLVSAGPAFEARAPVVTDDGWSVVFSSALFGGAAASFHDAEGDGCTEYYARSVSILYDLVQPGPKPVAFAAAEGTCGQVLFIEAMAAYAAVGPGVDPDAQKRLREAALADAPAGALRPFPAMLVRGEATRGPARKSFAWPLFFDRYAASCAAGRRGIDAEVPSESELEFVVEIRLARLFADRLDGGTASLRFDPFAAADDGGDADGVVTRAELRRVPLSGLAAEGDTYRDAPGGRGAPLLPGRVNARGPTLADFLDAQAMLAPAQNGQGYCGP
jgi:hypothetical protein